MAASFTFCQSFTNPGILESPSPLHSFIRAVFSSLLYAACPAAPPLPLPLLIGFVIFCILGTTRTPDTLYDWTKKLRVPEDDRDFSFAFAAFIDGVFIVIVTVVVLPLAVRRVDVDLIPKFVLSTIGGLRVLRESPFLEVVDWVGGWVLGRDGSELATLVGWVERVCADGCGRPLAGGSEEGDGLRCGDRTGGGRRRIDRSVRR
jgi:hypothetical protein